MNDIVKILVNGNPLKTYCHNGRIFIESREGAEYQIKLSNNTSSRLLAIVSVDGLNTIDGATATDDSPGYVLQGHSSYSVKGFRTSNDSVNAFQFSKKEKSYAAKHPELEGAAKNCGVIGVRFYTELKPAINLDESLNEWVKSKWPTWPTYPPEPQWDKIPQNPQYDWWKVTYSSTTDGCFNGPSNCCGNPEPLQNVLRSCSFDTGTKFTDKQIEDKVTETTFEKGSLFRFIEIFYASKQALIDMGIKIDKEPEIVFPQSFPKGFCKPPKKS